MVSDHRFHRLWAVLRGRWFQVFLRRQLPGAAGGFDALRADAAFSCDATPSALPALAITFHRRLPTAFHAPRVSRKMGMGLGQLGEDRAD